MDRGEPVRAVNRVIFAQFAAESGVERRYWNAP